MSRVSLLAFLLTLAISPTATADDPDIDAGSNNGGLFANGTKTDRRVSGSGSGRDVSVPTSKPQIVLGRSACTGATQVAQTEAPVAFCVPNQVYAEPVLTVGLIRRAFAELELPAGRLVIQPPDGLTLVNFDTNFYTTSTEPIARTVTLLGQRVTLEATPATYHWDFGDGRTLTTAQPGAPYPRLDVTHNYLRTGTYRPSLATTYTGRYRVGGGAWQEIPGTVTIDGAGQALRAIEAQPKLVGY